MRRPNRKKPHKSAADAKRTWRRSEHALFLEAAYAPLGRAVDGPPKTIARRIATRSPRQVTPHEQHFRDRVLAGLVDGSLEARDEDEYSSHRLPTMSGVVNRALHNKTFLKSAIVAFEESFADDSSSSSGSSSAIAANELATCGTLANSGGNVDGFSRLLALAPPTHPLVTFVLDLMAPRSPRDAAEAFPLPDAIDGSVPSLDGLLPEDIDYLSDISFDDYDPPPSI